MGRLILANTMNDLTYREVSPESTSLIDLFAFQELWLIEPGDVFVSPRPLPSGYLDLVCNVLNLSPSTFTCLSPNAYPDEPLLQSLKRTNMLSHLRDVTSTMPDVLIRACALDRPLVEVSKALGIPIEGYRDTPSISLLDTVDRLNTKSGFREIAKTLGLQVAPGFSDVSASGVESAIRQILSNHDEAIVKCDRGSGGSGQFRITKKSLIDNESVQGLTSFVLDKSQSGQTFAVEACLPLQLDPTIDVEITDSGTRRLYVGAMDCVNGVFSGMAVPAQGLSGKPLDDLHIAADRIGKFLFDSGYRGFFDIDAGLTTTGELCLFEANVRRTSTSLWAGVLERLAGKEYQRNVVWRVNTETMPAGYDFASLSSFAQRQSHFGSDGKVPKGMVTAWAPSAQQASFLYLALASTWHEVAALELELKNASLALA